MTGRVALKGLRFGLRPVWSWGLSEEGSGATPEPETVVGLLAFKPVPLSPTFKLGFKDSVAAGLI